MFLPRYGRFMAFTARQLIDDLYLPTSLVITQKTLPPPSRLKCTFSFQFGAFRFQHFFC
jgi:hypothetical protein